MILACNISIEKLESDLHTWKKLRQRKWEEFVAAGRKKTPHWEEMQKEYLSFGDYIASQLEMLCFQCMHSGTDPDPIRDAAFSQCRNWRDLLPKTETPQGFNISYHGFIGILDAQNYHGRKPHEPITFQEWVADADISKVPLYARGVFTQNLPPPIEDWSDMYNLIALHRDRIAEAAAVKNAYDNVPLSADTLARKSHLPPTEKPADYPLTPWEKYLEDNNIEAQKTYLRGSSSEKNQMRDIIARKVAEWYDDPNDPLLAQIEDIIRFPMSMPMSWQDEHHSPQQAVEFEEAGEGGITSYRLCVHCGRNDILDDDAVVADHLATCEANPDNKLMPILEIPVEDVEELPVPSDPFIAQVLEWQNDPKWRRFRAHVYRWERVLQALGTFSNHPTLRGYAPYKPITAKEVGGFVKRGWKRWVRVEAALKQRGVIA